MKKILLSFCLFLFAFFSFAENVTTTFDFSDPTTWKYDKPAVGAGVNITGNLTTDDITIVNESGSTSTRFWTTNNGVTELRVYNGATLTFTRSITDNFISIVFSGNNLNRMTVDKGNLVYGSGNSTATWTGNDASMIFKFSNTTNLYSIEVTTGVPAAVSTPSMTPVSQSFLGTLSVSIATTTADAKIYYTTNEDDPTSSSTEYTEEIKLTSTTTIKAIAVLGSDVSEITTETYTLGSEVSTISAWNSLADETLAKFTTSLTAIYQYGSNLYVTDGSDNMLIYGSLGKTYVNGDIIPSGIEGTKALYGGYLIEFVADASSVLASTEKGTEVSPDDATIADITTDNQCKYIVVKNVKYSSNTITSGSSSSATYNRFSVTLPTDDKDYNVTGFIGVNTNNGNAQLWPTSFDVVASVDNAFADSYSVSVSKGFIEITGSADTIEVYTIGGALISKDSAKIACSTGMYIVKVDGKATKVVVK